MISIGRGIDKSIYIYYKKNITKIGRSNSKEGESDELNAESIEDYMILTELLHTNNYFNKPNYLLTLDDKIKHLLNNREGNYLLHMREVVAYSLSTYSRKINNNNNNNDPILRNFPVIVSVSRWSGDYINWFNSVGLKVCVFEFPPISFEKMYTFTIQHIRYKLYNAVINQEVVLTTVYTFQRLKHAIIRSIHRLNNNKKHKDIELYKIEDTELASISDLLTRHASVVYYNTVTHTTSTHTSSTHPKPHNTTIHDDINEHDYTQQHHTPSESKGEHTVVSQNKDTVVSQNKDTVVSQNKDTVVSQNKDTVVSEVERRILSDDEPVNNDKPINTDNCINKDEIEYESNPHESVFMTPLYYHKDALVIYYNFYPIKKNNKFVSIEWTDGSDINGYVNSYLYFNKQSYFIIKLITNIYKHYNEEYDQTLNRTTQRYELTFQVHQKLIDIAVSFLSNDSECLEIILKDTTLEDTNTLSISTYIKDTLTDKNINNKDTFINIIHIQLWYYIPFIWKQKLNIHYGRSNDSAYAYPVPYSTTRNPIYGGVYNNIWEIVHKTFILYSIEGFTYEQMKYLTAENIKNKYETILRVYMTLFEVPPCHIYSISIPSVHINTHIFNNICN
eukprot:GHVR01110231.1.p1 GENE.GHVR01110231.1~~GHVR01110231.1.p1  ORF type:complete len:618 (+),score=145.93 GHVR01110231.1:520-2373(+)